jgi:hypothetical protein
MKSVFVGQKNMGKEIKRLHDPHQQTFVDDLNKATDSASAWLKS